MRKINGTASVSVILSVLLVAAVATSCGGTSAPEETSYEGTTLSFNDETSGTPVSESEMSVSAETTVTAETSESPETSDTSDTSGEYFSANLTASSLFDAIAEAYGDDFRATMAFRSEDIDIVFGVPPELYENYAAAQAPISAHVDKVAVFKAAPGKTGELFGVLTAARDKMAADTLNYPMNIAKVSSAKVVGCDDYVAFIMAGAIDDRGDATEDERKTFAEAETEKGINAFLACFGVVDAE